jgi:hypothetical protein
VEKSIEQIHSFKYADAIKMAEKFVSKNNLRMVLQLVHHKANGNIYATNSHHAIKVSGVHGFKEDYLVNVKSLEFAKGQYPDMDKLFEIETKAIIRLNESQIKLWLQMFKSMNQMSKQKGVQNRLVMFLDDDIRFELDQQDVSFKLPFEEYEGHENINKVKFQIDYMRNALEAHEKLKSKELFITFQGELNPILLDNQDDVQAIVLPVRVY